MTDGVRQIEFQGSPAWAITWRGEMLQMYWGSAREAKQHLWMLNNPEAAEQWLKFVTEDSGAPLVDRFSHLKSAYRHRKKAA
jgi:hypothetical protein